ncbi:MAG: hypothetical protein KAU95_01550 [Candidatus Aenigmarchaeota archaeon]|nr:hypothetical protein [Candidatus Aenigmarchaeota archaeon]
MLKQIFAVGLLLSLVFISGCTIPDFEGGFGQQYCSAIGICEVDEVEVEIPDVIVIDEIKVLPMAGNRVRPNTELDIIVTLKNKDDNKAITLTYIGISNPGIFDCLDCKKTGKINPGQLKTFQFRVKSPDNEGTMAWRGELEFSVKYEYTSTRVTTLTFIERETYIQYLNSGGKVKVHISNVPSDGPVEVYLDISKIQQPIILGASVKLSGFGGISILNEDAKFRGLNIGGLVLASPTCPTNEASCKTPVTTDCDCGGLNALPGDYCCASSPSIHTTQSACYTVCGAACKCSDGTICGHCSGSLPKMCQDGTLVDWCSFCGCPTGTNCQSDGTCSSTSKPGGSSEPTGSSEPKQEEGRYQLHMELRNQGNGEIDEIGSGNLEMTFEDMNLKACSDELNCGGSTVTNNDPIVLRGKKSFRYYISFDPGSGASPGADEITTVKKIKTKVTYKYRLPETIKILVSPRAEI